MRLLSIKVILYSLSIFLLGCQNKSSNTAWKSYSGDASIEAKVDSLLSLMTIEEKIGQLTQFSGQGTVTGPQINDDFKEYMDKGQVGSMFNVVGAKGLRQLQEHALKHSRLKIPILFAADVIHGFKTTFPMPLAESCSWDLELMEKSARISAIEATAAGLCWTFAPMIDISRDPRWGRVMESAGEDVYFTNLVAAAKVKGYQGISSYKDFSDPHTMLACAKHFVGYGAGLAGRDYHSVDMSDRTLRETYLPPFKSAVDNGVATFMTSFNTLNGVPATGNKYIFKDILRDEWNFKGGVVTDYTAINELVPHGYAQDLKEAANKALNAGIDMDMNGAAFIQHLKTLLDEGKVTEEQINVAASRMLELKFLLGLFDDPFKYLDEKREKENTMKPEFLAEALKNAERSIVLLKNEKVLPLASTTSKRVALIGPMIKERRSLNGEWAIQGDRRLSTTVYEGLTEKYKNAKFTYAQGATLTGDVDRKEINKAVAVAKNSDLVIMALGEDFNWSGEAASRTDIQIPLAQKELLRAVKKTGKKIVLVLLNGRPLDLSWEDENVDAIVEAWYPGIKAGDAIANILSGDYNPSAKLTMTFPRNVGQIPIYYNTLNTGRPHDHSDPKDYTSFYLDVPNSPLYPFGYGLSYSTFKYHDAKLSNTTLSANGKVTASIKVTNESDVDGEEIVQLYIQDVAASVAQPIKSLKGFEKLSIQKGQTIDVQFEITPEMLAILDIDMNKVTEEGKFNIWIAPHAEYDGNLMQLNYTE
ncbi:beta-glucosidase BglX [Flammeovirga yaeyamensis]|uniref:beta-glucosidase n=1 Tax=Flammeovirga yaeyamensis TaxID=367791 RepID=A0AAX1N0Y8_9BACT|nr:beta-glucosidase BglX [Flammeovirga yaeyamensis]MBB3698499.1 beta-glucosidase [Flammeovirga yaeyamensis]NMF34152.1 beta-glucosidase BglX [Flammeovirga yaeyamensis]QWG01137.1 beta-glucosidase BglX [Flammeovirga yaeyamensis]